MTKNQLPNGGRRTAIRSKNTWKKTAAQHQRRKVTTASSRLKMSISTGFRTMRVVMPKFVTLLLIGTRKGSSIHVCHEWPLISLRTSRCPLSVNVFFQQQGVWQHLCEVGLKHRLL